MPPADRSSPRLGYLPALDGLRALAVGAVLAYHLGFSRVPGGFVGVEVFFVLSGWLVCALLAGEHRATGTIDLKAFWLRRARRLLPAVTLMMATVLAAAVATGYNQLASLRADGLAALTYVLNWRLIIDQQSYFEAAGTRPSPLLHLWSLSIEEQFYLLLPLALGLALAVRRSAPQAAMLILAGAVASTAWRLVLDTPIAEADRVYYGTDTRAAGLLLGVALGLVWHPGRLRSVPGRWAAIPLDAVALGGLAILWWYTTQVSELDPNAFRWSLTAAQLGTLVVIAAVVHPVQGLVARAMSTPPMRWVGQRSYGIYLWHWPIIVAWAKAPGEQPETPLVTVALVAATLLVAAASYRWVEQPIRQHGVRDYLTGARDGIRSRLATRPLLASGATALSVLGLVGCMVVVRDLAAPPASADHSSTATAVEDPPTTPAPATTEPPAAPAQNAAAQPAPPPPPPPAPTPETTALGDSVMVGATPALSAQFGHTLLIDADIGRQGIDAANHMRQLADTGRLRDVVILHLGTNGPFSANIVDEIRGIVGDRWLILVNTKVPRRWEAEVNSTLADAARRLPKTTMVDWHRVAVNEPGVLRPDGYHLTVPGSHRYAALLADTARKLR